MFKTKKPTYVIQKKLVSFKKKLGGRTKEEEESFSSLLIADGLPNKGRVGSFHVFGIVVAVVLVV